MAHCLPQKQVETHWLQCPAKVWQIVICAREVYKGLHNVTFASITLILNGNNKHVIVWGLSIVDQIVLQLVAVLLLSLAPTFRR